MLVTSLVVTCLFALMGVLQTLPGDGISATLARMLVPTISGPSRTLRISRYARRRACMQITPGARTLTPGSLLARPRFCRCRQKLYPCH